MFEQYKTQNLCGKGACRERFVFLLLCPTMMPKDSFQLPQLHSQNLSCILRKTQHFLLSNQVAERPPSVPGFVQIPSTPPFWEKSGLSQKEAVFFFSISTNLVTKGDASATPSNKKLVCTADKQALFLRVCGFVILGRLFLFFSYGKRRLLCHLLPGQPTPTLCLVSLS